MAEVKKTHVSIGKCRICGNARLQTVLDLGSMSVTGMFPRSSEDDVPVGPLTLVKCSGKDSCGLVQLKDTFEPGILYGASYGYSSALNKSMVRHLEDIVNYSKAFVSLSKKDLIMDIGSNDGTLLSFFPRNTYTLLGVDPTANKFIDSYREDIHVLSDFFSEEKVRNAFPDEKAKIITSIAMFYDLEDPVGFAKDVASLLDDQGIWVLEQSYCNTMIKNTSYDTICHEHLEYYNLKQIKWIMDEIGMKIISIRFNDVNGGSFQIIAAKKNHPSPEIKEKINNILKEEKKIEQDPKTFEIFRNTIEEHKKKLIDLLRVSLKGASVYGYGASTKGNVILQYVGLSSEDIPYIMEINPDKFGRVTPGTHIPIISEEEARRSPPDYFLVLPWHFRETILQKETFYKKHGTKFIFPLPTIDIV